ncbi:hypothetical protein DIPPA_32041 [Diplonema papillatum]|nr:hypothetical protein DIPPA_32041 [Diplonema papillatum]
MINQKSKRLMLNRSTTPAWQRSDSESPKFDAANVRSQTADAAVINREPMLSDVLQACLSASQAVERLQSPPAERDRLWSASPWTATRGPYDSLPGSPSSGAKPGGAPPAHLSMPDPPKARQQQARHGEASPLSSSRRRTASASTALSVASTRRSTTPRGASQQRAFIPAGVASPGSSSAAAHQPDFLQFMAARGESNLLSRRTAPKPDDKVDAHPRRSKSPPAPATAFNSTTPQNDATRVLKQPADSHPVGAPRSRSPRSVNFSGEDAAALRRTVSQQQRQLDRQAAHIAELSAVVAHLAGLLRADVASVRRGRERTAARFWSEDPGAAAWAAISSFLPLREAMRLRLLGKAPKLGAEARYEKWFYTSPMPSFRVRNNRWVSMYLPGRLPLQLQLSGNIMCKLEEQLPDGTRRAQTVFKHTVLRPPMSIRVKGTGIVQATPWTSDYASDDDGASGGGPAEGPQGKIHVLSVSRRGIRAEFTHPKWYPLPGDGVALLSAGAVIAPLCPSIEDEKCCFAFLPNNEGAIPWTVSIDVPDDIPPGSYELRYLDSLAHPLGSSAPFEL